MKNKIQSFFWGILTAGIVLFLELILDSFFNIDYSDTANIIFVIMIALSVVIEEIAKYIIILKKVSLLSFGRNAMVNAWMAGIGFFLVEFFIFYQKSLMENLIFNQMDLLRIGLLHILIFGVFGYRVAIRKNDKLDISIIAIVIILHLVYNISIQYMGEISHFAVNLLLIVLALYNVFGIITVNKKFAHN